MKRVAILLFSMLLAGCGENAVPDTELAQTHSRQFSNYYDYLIAGEPNVIARSNGRAQRSGDTLTLALTHSKTAKFTQGKNCVADGADGECYTYHLMAVWPSRNLYLVHRGYFEGGEYLLVDDRTGEQLVLTGVPEFAPDKKRFISINDEGMNGEESNIEIYRLTDDSLPVREWSARASGVALTFLSMRLKEWVGEEIRLELLVGQSPAQGARLTKRGDDWQLSLN